MPTSACAGGGMQHIVVVAYGHESDTTSQSLAQHVLQLFGRATRRRLATEILNQRGVFKLVLKRVDGESGEVVDTTETTQHWHSYSYAILDESSPFIAEALTRGMPFDLGGPLWESWQLALQAGCDAVIVDQRADKGSNNRPAIKHIIGTIGELGISLCDTTVCELHVINGIKSSAPNLRTDVGHMFALGNICKVASHHYALVACILDLCNSSVQRIVQPPPTEENDTALLLDALFDTSADDHRRANKESFLLQDVQALGAIRLHELLGQGSMQTVRVHYCWGQVTRRACCKDEEETKERASLAHVILFGEFGDRGCEFVPIHERRKSEEEAGRRHGQ